MLRCAAHPAATVARLEEIGANIFAIEKEFEGLLMIYLDTIMALEEDIVNWSKSRPAWQREVMRRMAIGETLSDNDYDKIVGAALTETTSRPVSEAKPTFGLEHMPKASPQDSPVRIASIERTEHLNALSSDNPLTFEPNGLTIVYGDNGSGKSGYARLLKRITQARHREDILSHVFRDTTMEKPTAALSVLIGEEKKAVSWPTSSAPELRRMLFYDSACGNTYINTELEFPYRPSALAVMDGLINACVEVRKRLDVKLAENERKRVPLPGVAAELNHTGIGRYLNQISADSSVAGLDALIATLDSAKKTTDELKKEEMRLRNADTSRERQHLTWQEKKLKLLYEHVKKLHSTLSNEMLSALQKSRNNLATLQDEANNLARCFDLQGVGTSAWKDLWESAEKFSKQHAYVGQPFPAVAADDRCVLCQKTLGDDGRDRLLKFKKFVEDDTQVRVDKTRQTYNKQKQDIKDLNVAPENVSNNMKELEDTYAPLMAELRALLGQYTDVRQATIDAISADGDVALCDADPLTVLTSLEEAMAAAQKKVAELSDPAIIQKMLADVALKRQELELLQEVKGMRDRIAGEVARLKEHKNLEDTKTLAATNAITNKILNLSEEGITEVVRDTFTRETDRLQLKHVTIAKTNAPRGAILHQPKLVGARQNVKLPHVFSEGERTALGLAAFFTEAHLDESKSAIILDDPVTSLDHIHRERVAARLTEFARDRQVIIFTHDISFVADLKLETRDKGVTVTERSVIRSWAEKRPGMCSTDLPWKARDAKARLVYLRQRLNSIQKESKDEKEYEEKVASWAGGLSETWERIFSQEIVGRMLEEGGLEVRPQMVKILACFTDADRKEFEASYSRLTRWAKRHDKNPMVNPKPPEVDELEAEITRVEAWFKRIKTYKQ